MKPCRIYREMLAAGFLFNFKLSSSVFHNTGVLRGKWTASVSQQFAAVLFNYISWEI